MNIKTVAATILLSTIALTGCGTSTPNTPPTTLGKPEVYESIKAETNCDKLQKDFDQADANGERNRQNGKLELAQISTSYMEAILARQTELKCFG
jgi:hypothetical protein